MKILRVTPEFMQDVFALHGFTTGYLTDRVSELVGEPIELVLIGEFVDQPVHGENVDIHVDLKGNIILKR